ncbi:hypothetical protein J6S46_01700, partial [Candidatus Saccharibacteria bacterium]|nr:hypothetical protein [Candidatus Saccharibacteria bacterium]
MTKSQICCKIEIVRNKPSARVARSRDSLYKALISMVSEDDYNLSIQSSELCVRANKGRATFFRQYRQVGDIFKMKHLEMIAEFSTKKYSCLTQTMVWSR